MSSFDALASGALVGRYQIVRLLGAGGMGAVYEALHVDLEKRVALKVLLPGVAANPEARARFLREARLTARLRHRHVVDVTDVGVVGDTPFLVMEYLEGESLAALLHREGPLPIARLADLLLPVLAAIAAAHELGIVHRDLKPDNVFLAQNRDGSGIPKVLDFGISKAADRADGPALTGTAALLGTPSYLSPEQAQGARDVDARSDQYALGVLLYEAVTGQLPYVRETLYALLIAIVAGDRLPPRAHRPDLPEAFETVVLRAMAGDREARFASVRELGLALLPFATAPVRATWTATFESPSATAAELANTLEGPPRSSIPTPATTMGITARAIDVRDRSPARTTRRLLWSGALLLTLALVVVASLLPARRGAARRVAAAPATPSVARSIAIAPPMSGDRVTPGVTATIDSPSGAPAAAAQRPVPAPLTRSRAPDLRVVRSRPVSHMPTPSPGAAPRPAPPTLAPPSTDGTNQAPILE